MRERVLQVKKHHSRSVKLACCRLGTCTSSDSSTPVHIQAAIKLRYLGHTCRTSITHARKQTRLCLATSAKSFLGTQCTWKNTMCCQIHPPLLYRRHASSALAQLRSGATGFYAHPDPTLDPPQPSLGALSESLPQQPTAPYLPELSGAPAAGTAGLGFGVIVHQHPLLPRVLAPWRRWCTLAAHELCARNSPLISHKTVCSKESHFAGPRHFAPCADCSCSTFYGTL